RNRPRAALALRPCPAARRREAAASPPRAGGVASREARGGAMRGAAQPRPAMKRGAWSCARRGARARRAWLSARGRVGRRRSIRQATGNARLDLAPVDAVDTHLGLQRIDGPKEPTEVELAAAMFADQKPLNSRVNRGDGHTAAAALVPGSRIHAVVAVVAKDEHLARLHDVGGLEGSHRNGVQREIGPVFEELDAYAAEDGGAGLVGKNVDVASSVTRGHLPVVDPRQAALHCDAIARQADDALDQLTG